MIKRLWAGFYFWLIILVGCATLQSDPPEEVPSTTKSEPSLYVHDFCFSNDGKRLAVSGRVGKHITLLKGRWVLQDLPTGATIQAGFLSHSGAHAVALSLDGKWIAVGGDEAELKIIHAVTGEVYADLEGHRTGVMQVEFTPDNNYLVSCSSDNMVRVWNVASKRPHATFRFTSDNNFWKIWPDRPHERAPVTVTFSDSIRNLYRFALAPNGRTLAVAAGTRDVKILELLTGKIERTVHLQDAEKALAIVYSRDGKRLAVGGGGDGSVVEVWDLDAGKHLITLKQHHHSCLCVAFSPDGATVASSGTTDGVRVWDLATGRQKYHLFSAERQRFPGRDCRVVAVKFTPDGKLLTTAHYRWQVQFWDAASGHAISSGAAKVK